MVGVTDAAVRPVPAVDAVGGGGVVASALVATLERA